MEHVYAPTPDLYDPDTAARIKYHIYTLYPLLNNFATQALQEEVPKTVYSISRASVPLAVSVNLQEKVPGIQTIYILFSKWKNYLTFFIKTLMK